MLFETYEFVDDASSKPILICAGVIFFFIVGAIALFIYRDIGWRKQQIRIAEKKCKEYTKLACNNTNSIMSPIINGVDVSLGIIPHQAFVELMTVNYPIKTRKCGGSLISEYFVLSAAHCVYGLKTYKGMVKLGSVTQYQDGTGEWFAIQRAYLHYSYEYSTKENDVALLKLDQKVNFKSYLRPICLNTKFTGQYDNVTASGWGRTESLNESSTLKMVELTIYNKSMLERKCHTRKYAYVNLICAGQPDRSNSVHQGDSGGPLQVPLKTGCPYTYELIGITSAVENREIKFNRPLHSYYSKVEFYVPWIASHVWSDEPDKP